MYIPYIQTTVKKDEFGIISKIMNLETLKVTRGPFSWKLERCCNRLSVMQKLSYDRNTV